MEGLRQVLSVEVGCGACTGRLPNPSEDVPYPQAEVDCYICLSAQALTYKLGQLEILVLRDRAREALRARFDVHAEGWIAGQA